MPIPAEDEAALKRLLEAHEALVETRDLARKASENATAFLDGLEGEKKTKALLHEIPVALLDRSK